jgi:hypothetical protein
MKIMGLCSFRMRSHLAFSIPLRDHSWGRKETSEAGSISRSHQREQREEREKEIAAF